MQVKHLIAAAAIACAATGASAATYLMGDVTAAGGFSFDSSSLSGSFSDTYVFSIADLSDLSISVTNAFTTSNGKIASFAGLLSGPGLAGSALGLTTIGKMQVLSGDLSTAMGGEYTLTLSGSAMGTGYYGGVASVSPVPEPETYGLMLAGLGAIAFVARRRLS